MGKPTPQEVDEYILANLPATFLALYLNKPGEWYRPIDRGLQRLRKKGMVTWSRYGGVPVWRPAD